MPQVATISRQVHEDGWEASIIVRFHIIPGDLGSWDSPPEPDDIKVVSAHWEVTGTPVKLSHEEEDLLYGSDYGYESDPDPDDEPWWDPEPYPWL
jgi:hypothetical protein